MGRGKVVLASVVGTLAVLLLVGFGVIFTGFYDVAASDDHTGLTRWTLRTVARNSVTARAAKVAGVVPADSATLEHGFVHFDAMCVGCHGAPGYEPGEVGQGLSPRPPDLADEAGEWSDAELFWITKHGLKFTGMPAFGPTHADEELWGIVAFVRRLSAMTPEQYEAWRPPPPDSAADSAAVHVHADGTGHRH